MADLTRDDAKAEARAIRLCLSAADDDEWGLLYALREMRCCPGCAGATVTALAAWVVGLLEEHHPDWRDAALATLAELVDQ